MTTVIVIIIIAVILYFLFWNKKTDDKTIAASEDDKNKSQINHVEAEELTEEEIFTDENGLEYKLVENTREIPRRTYIKATLNGKYWGEIDEQYSNQFEHSKFFDFNIYEVTLQNAVYNSIEAFQLEQDLKIPREKLPKLLHTVLEKDGKEYEVNLHEPIFANIKFNRKLHQDEGNEVFGTIDAVVTGYILDFTKEIYFEKKYIVPIAETLPITEIEEPNPTKTNTPTGNVERNGNYKRIEYFYSDYKKTYWSDWKYTKPVTTTDN